MTHVAIVAIHAACVHPGPSRGLRELVLHELVHEGTRLLNYDEWHGWRVGHYKPTAAAQQEQQQAGHVHVRRTEKFKSCKYYVDLLHMHVHVHVSSPSSRSPRACYEDSKQGLVAAAFEMTRTRWLRPHASRNLHVLGAVGAIHAPSQQGFARRCPRAPTGVPQQWPRDRAPRARRPP